MATRPAGEADEGWAAGVGAGGAPRAFACHRSRSVSRTMPTSTARSVRSSSQSISSSAKVRLSG
jgi:hypothetical protein